MRDELPRERRPREQVHAVRRWLQEVHSPEYLAAKGEYLGRFSVVATLITAVFVAFTWIWDLSIDPTALGVVFWLRMAQALSVLLLAVAMWQAPQGRLTRLGLFAVPAFVQVTYIIILGRLDEGASYGVGGFLYFFIFVPFMAQAQNLRFNAVLLGFLALLPNLIVAAGIGAQLNLPVFNAYVWMAYGPIMLILALIEYLIHQVHVQGGQLRHAADIDPLTGVANRRYFARKGEETLALAAAEGRTVSLLYIDVDHFKPVNDRYGHARGDQVLQQLVERIRQCTRDDDLVARLGGEEFAVLLPDTDHDLAHRVARRICRQVADEPFRGREPGAPAIDVTVSVGVITNGVQQECGIGLEGLMNAADAALYRAKEHGRNQVVAEAPQPAI